MTPIKAPFPWFGGKSRAAPLVWARFGDVRNYVEPFAGSLAVLLGRPDPFSGTETVNDLDGYLANFWRALIADPEAVAHHADWPVNENDLHARHVWLVERRDSLQARLEGDPDFYDAKIAGWWAWGIACWIGSGFCSGKGPWRRAQNKAGEWVLSNDAELNQGAWRQLVHLGAGQGVNRQRVHLVDAGQGVNRQRVHLVDAGQGVNRQRVHLGNAGQGVNRQRVHLGNAGRGVNRKRVHLGNAGQGEATRAEGSIANGSSGLLDWFDTLAARLARVRVCCGDWRRVCGGKSGDALKCLFAGGPTCGIFLDPPYADTAQRTSDLYRIDSESIAHDVRDWALEHGDDPRLRICLAGYEGEHKMPRGWACVEGKATNGGYGSQAKSNKMNYRKERLWFSPHCLKIKVPTLV